MSNKKSFSLNQVLFLIVIILTLSAEPCKSLSLLKKLSAQSKSTTFNAQTCINEENFNLVKRLKKEGYILNSEVEKVMCTLDRADFVSKDGYDWEPAYIGYGATLSAPRVHAWALEKLYEKFKGQTDLNILDIGSGSGYLCVAFSLLFPDAKITGIEHVWELVDNSIDNIKKNYAYLLENKTIKIIHGDGRKGFPELAPFDYVHSGASFAFNSNTIIDQIRNGGRMCTPENNEIADNCNQSIYVIDKNMKGDIKKTPTLKECYVALQDSSTQVKLGEKNIETGVDQ
jgi:protein-L-isoaspartate(D-aspartate) O-methyltransferase